MGRYSYASLLKKQAKEREKEAQLESARLAAEGSRARIEELKSAHRTASSPVDWWALAATLPPPQLSRRASREALATRRHLALRPLGVPATLLPRIEAEVAADVSAAAAAVREHQAEAAEQSETAALARSVLRGEHDGYRQVLAEQSFDAFAPLGGVSVDFEIHSSRLIEASVVVQSTSVLPTEVHSLTATGKLSTKQMPRIQFVELYQDYVCSLVLRVVRELHALLPIDAAIATAHSNDGLPSLSPVLSVIVHREHLSSIAFATVDPSDALEQLEARSNFKTSRRTGAFQPISPYSLRDVRFGSRATSFDALKEAATRLLEDLE
jgi:hypothetical protein